VAQNQVHDNFSNTIIACTFITDFFNIFNKSFNINEIYLMNMKYYAIIIPYSRDLQISTVIIKFFYFLKMSLNNNNIFKFATKYKV